MFTGAVQQQRVQKDYTDWGDLMMGFYRAENPDQARYFDMTIHADLTAAMAATKQCGTWHYVTGESGPIRVWETSINQGAGGWVLQISNYGWDSDGLNPGKGYEETYRRLFAREYPHTRLADTFGPFSSDYKTANAQFVKIWGVSQSTWEWAQSSRFQKTGAVAFWAGGSGRYDDWEWNTTNFPGETTWPYPQIWQTHSNIGTNTKGWMYVACSDGFSGVTNFDWARDPVGTDYDPWRGAIPHFPVSSMNGLVDAYPYWAFTRWNSPYPSMHMTMDATRLPPSSRIDSGACNFSGIDGPVITCDPTETPFAIEGNRATSSGMYLGQYTTAVYGHPGSYIHIKNAHIGGLHQGFLALWLSGLKLSASFDGVNTGAKVGYTFNTFNGYGATTPDGHDIYGNRLVYCEWDTVKAPVYDCRGQASGWWPYHHWTVSGYGCFHQWSGKGTLPTMIVPPMTYGNSVSQSFIRGILYYQGNYVEGPVTFDFQAGVCAGIVSYFGRTTGGGPHGEGGGGATIGTYDCTNVCNVLDFTCIDTDHVPGFYNIGAHASFKHLAIMPFNKDGSHGLSAANLNTMMTNCIVDRAGMSSPTLYIHGNQGTATCDTSIATAKNWNVDTTTDNPSIPVSDV